MAENCSSNISEDTPKIQRGISYDLTKKQQEEVRYGNYLKLDKILGSQDLLSQKILNKTSHDEHLFIIIHQVYELWFKQILHELDSIIEILSAHLVDERNMLVVVSRLNRVIQIYKIMIPQFGVIETMTSIDFMEFRDLLAPASGFQSAQFRMLELRLGISETGRVQYAQYNYKEVLSEKEAKAIEEVAKKPSLLQVVNSWLERTPGLEKDGFDFWTRYEEAAQRMLQDMEAEVEENSSHLTPHCKERRVKDYKKQKETFDALFNEELYKEKLKSGGGKLSYKAFQGALMIFLYRQEPRFHQPFQLLSYLMDVDALMIKWRQSHVSMVQRMIGIKVGTGGSSGYDYLRSTAGDRYKVFLDLCIISTYVLPREYIPKLTNQMLRRLSVHISAVNDLHVANEVDDGSSV